MAQLAFEAHQERGRQDLVVGVEVQLEVVPEAVKVMKAAAAKSGLQIEWLPLPIGNASSAGAVEDFSRVRLVSGMASRFQCQLNRNL